MCYKLGSDSINASFQKLKQVFQKVLKGSGVGGWVSMVVGIMEGIYCMEHCVWCENNEFWNSKKIKFNLKKRQFIGCLQETHFTLMTPAD